MIQPRIYDVLMMSGLAIAGMAIFLFASQALASSDGDMSAKPEVPTALISDRFPLAQDLHHAPSIPASLKPDQPKAKRLAPSERESLGRELRETLRDLYDQPHSSR